MKKCDEAFAAQSEAQRASEEEGIYFEFYGPWPESSRATQTADIAETREPNRTTRRWRPWQWLIAGIAIVLLIAIAIPMTLAYRAEPALARMRDAGAHVQIYAPSPRSRGWLDRAWRDLRQELPEGFQCLHPELEVSVLFDMSAAIDDQWLVDHDFSSLRCRMLIGISHPDITDVGIRELADIPQLEALLVSRTRLTDDGLKAFARHESLSLLGLHRTEVTAQGISVLATLPQLQNLDMSGTDITGEELCQLCSCAQLQSFHVDPDQLTASLASHFRHFPRLCDISIRPARMSLPGWPETQSSAPCDDATLWRLLNQMRIEHLMIYDGRGITECQPRTLACSNPPPISAHLRCGHEPCSGRENQYGPPSMVGNTSVSTCQ